MADVRRDKSGKPVKARAPRRKILATLDPTELQEYAQRRYLVESKHREMLAAGAYVDVMTAEMVEKYNLPIQFDLDFETGQIKEVPA
jgi:hypothetical protein